MRRAQSRLTGQVQQVMRDTVGEDEATVQAVVASYQQRFPEPPPPDSPAYGGELRIGEVEDDAPPRPPTSPRQPPRRTRPNNDDDDDWGGPILRS